MAGDWFPVRNSLSRDPMVLKIARDLSRSRHALVTLLSRFCHADVTLESHDGHAAVTSVCDMLCDLSRTKAEVIGNLILLWSWGDEQTEDGFLDGIAIEDLPAILGGAIDCWQAIAHNGWLISDASGLQIPSFDKYLGNSSKRRLNATERKRRQREREKAGHALVTKMSRSERDQSVTREEKRREEKRTYKKPLLSPFDPPGFDGKDIELIQQMSDVRRRVNPNAAELRASANLRHLVHQRLADGYSSEEILTVWEWVLTSDHPRAKILRQGGLVSAQQILSVGAKGAFLDEYLDLASNPAADEACKRERVYLEEA